MASKRRAKRKQCQGKVAHSQEAAVREAIRKTRAGDHAEAFDAYPCPNCGSWHVGHRPKKVRQAIDSRRRA